MEPPQLLGSLEAALYADDLDAAEAFYGGILGLEEITRKEGRHIFFAVGQSVLLIFRPEATRAPPPSGSPLPVPPHGATGPGHYCFAVAAEKMAEWRDFLVASGIGIEADFEWPNGARSIYVRDPAGNSVEFAQPELWF